MDRWPLHKAYFWERAPFFRLLVPLVLGIVLYDVVAWHQWTTAHWVGMGVCMLLTVIGAFGKGRGMNLLLFVAMNCLLLGCGYGISYLNDATNSPAWYGTHINRDCTYVARITAEPAGKERSWKVPVEMIAAINSGTIVQTCGAGIVYVYKDELPMLYHKGDTLLLPASWQPVANAGNPYEFDHARYLRRNNVYCQQFCAGRAVRLYALHNALEESYTERMHNWCMAQLDANITDASTKGLIQAMLLGDEVNLDADLRQSFSDTGIVHVIAISGGNVMMFFVVIGWLLIWIKNKKYTWISYIVALPLVWFYVLMAGASPSAIRAAIMFSLLAGGVVSGKNNNSLNQLFATAFALLCAQPMWLYSIGFQLSFVAVLSLIIFYAPIYGLHTSTSDRKYIPWIKKKIWETICASMAAEILVAPLVVCYFHNFPTMFLMANVLAFGFMFVVLMLGILIIATCWLPLVPAIVGMVTAGLVAVFNYILAGLELFNPQSFHFLRLTAPQLLLIYVAIAGIAVWVLRQQRRGLLVALSAMCVFSALLCVDKYHSLQQQRLVVYNTGKANHIELNAGNHYQVLYTDTNAAKQVVYATQPAHIEWQAWHPLAAAKDSLLYVDGQTILILNKEPQTGSFPVDCLVVNYKAPPNLALLQSIFHPHTVVVGNNYTRKEQEAWVKAGAAARVHVHAVAIDGAFMRPGK